MLFFIPMIGVVVGGMMVHNQVRNLHTGDLDKKEVQYEEILNAQAKKGIVMDKIIGQLKDLQDSSKNYHEYQNVQITINDYLNEMKAIQPQISDSIVTRIRSIPMVYDSLLTDIKLIQTTRDSIKTCEQKISNLKFQLEQCLESLGERLAEKGKEEDTP